MNRKLIVSILTFFMLFSGISVNVNAEEPETDKIFEQEEGGETTPDPEINPGEGEEEPAPPVASPAPTEDPQPQEPPKETEEPAEPTEPPAEDNIEDPGVNEPENPEPGETEAPDLDVPEKTPEPTETPKPTEMPEPEKEEEKEPEAVIEEDESSWQEIWLPPGNIIRSYEDTKGSDWTSRAALAAKLDSIFRGNIGVTDADHKPVNAPLGSHAVLPGLTLWACDRIHTGQSCFIYALGIYYTLFGEDPYLYRDHSEIVTDLTGRTEFSKEVLENAGLRHEPGAYVRTLGHSLIVLNYDDEGIDVVQGNVGGDGFICISQYTWEEFNAAIMLSGSTCIEVVFQPTDAWFNHVYPLEDAVYETEPKRISSETSFWYDRTVLENTETELSPEIAKMAKILADAADDPEQTASILEQMDFEADHIYIHNEEDQPLVWTIAKQSVYENVKSPYELVIVTAGDKDDSIDWLNAYVRNEEGYHSAFYEQAQSIKENLNEIPNEETDRIYLIAANGTAGSAANILAKDLIHEAEQDETNHDRVFGYTFGALPVSEKTEEEDAEHGIDGSLSAVFNFVNEDDLLYGLASNLYGYRTNGKTVKLNHEKDDPVYLNFREQFRNANGHGYRPISPDYASLAALNEEEKKMVIDASAVLLQEEGSYASLYELLKALYKDDLDLLQEETAQKIIDSALENEIADVHELENAQQILADLSAAMTKAEEAAEEAEKDIEEKEITEDTEETAEPAELTEPEETEEPEEPSEIAVLLDALEKIVKLDEQPQKTEDLAATAKKLNQAVSRCRSLKGTFLRYLSLFVSEDHTSADLINDTLNETTYRLWINSMYFGDHGWQGYKGRFIQPDFAGRGITTIADACFKDAEITGELSLYQIHSIGIDAFKGSSFESLVLDPALHQMAEGSFAGMGNLTKITLPLNVSYTAESEESVSPFEGDTNVSEITYTAGKKKETEETDEGSWRPERIAKESIQKLVYEEGIESIPAGKETDKTKESAAEVILPSSLKNIEDYAFAGWNLETINIPESVKSIGEEAFADNPQLKIYAINDSYAAEYAEKHEIETVILEKQPTRVAFAKKGLRMGIHEEAQPKVTADPSDIKDALKFESSDESVVTVDQNGNIETLNEGIACITVSFGNVKDRCLIRVMAENTAKPKDNLLDQ